MSHALGLVLLLALTGGTAPYRVVVAAQCPVQTLSAPEATAYFLKKSSSWPDGSRVQPVDLPADDPARAAFSAAVLHRSVAAVKAYWQQRVFSGRELPPPEKASDAEVLAYVRANPRAIGYVSAGADTTGLRVLSITE